MFIRKKKNRSGSTSVVVVDKSRRGFRGLVTIGVCSDNAEIESLWQQKEDRLKLTVAIWKFLNKSQGNKKRNK